MLQHVSDFHSFLRTNSKFPMVCMYHVFVYLFVHQWTLGLFPPFGDRE